MKSTFQHWLEQGNREKRTVQTRLSHAKRVEEFYGNLDEHYDQDQLRNVIDELKYSAEDERRNRSNPSKLPINGNIRNNLASYKNATELYCTFRRDTADGEEFMESSVVPSADLEEVLNERGQLVGLERDLQAALRLSIEQLEPGLEIIDDGAERSVSSGFIDITARDANGSIVVIELKTGTARQKAVAQVLSYMGDVADEEPDADVRGILVAGYFDSKTRAAARIVPTLSLWAYRMNFEFKNAGETLHRQAQPPQEPPDRRHGASVLF